MNKVYCWECKFLNKDNSYCTKKHRIVNTCLKNCGSYKKRIG